LVAGFHTEYSGFRWLILFMAEYGSMFAVSGIATVLFLGGWHTGLVPWELGASDNWLWLTLGNLVNVLVFMFKGFMLVFVMMWVRWTLPRLRIDQVMMACLKYMLPISCTLLLGVSFWQLAIPRILAIIVQGLLVIGCLLIPVWGIIKAAISPTAGLTGLSNTALTRSQ
jgi:NADH-quinone oxidoreductase subunit H